jgi:hypothetical protein
MPSGAGPEGTLEATRTLLRNPLGPGASLSEAKQWHHDVNQLVVAMINTSLNGGQRANHSHGTPELSPTLSCTPIVARAPSLGTHANGGTTDLRAELKHRRSGENDRTTIEHHRERHCNLNGDYGTSNVASVGHATYTPTSPGFGGGCMAFSPHLRMVVLPHKFRPHLLKNMMGPSIPSSSCRSTPPPSLQQGKMRMSWPTTFLWS